MDVVFLEPTSPGCKAAKRFYKDNQGNIESDYITGARFTSHNESINNLTEFTDALKRHADAGNCVLKGLTNRSLDNSSRRGSTDTETSTSWILLDLDGLKGVDNVESFLKNVGLEHYSYIVQYSSSMGVVPDKGLSAHIFMMLDQSIPAPILKEWLKELNFKNDFLYDGLTLTATNVALKWPLDISTCQNDKLIFITPPLCEDGVEDTFKGSRIQHVSKSKDYIDSKLITDGQESRFEANIDANNSCVERLRQQAGLKRRSLTMRTTKSGLEYLAKPSTSAVTGVKRDGEYVRLNLNGGDSWAYYHPADNAEILFNFKGEPNYLLKELAPDYYHKAAATATDIRRSEAGTHTESYIQEAVNTGTAVYMGVRDVASDQYYTVSYFPEADELEAYPVKSKDRINDFLTDKGMSPIEFVPDWNVVYSLESDNAMDYRAKTINLFSATKFLQKPNPYMVSTYPTQADFPTIYSLIDHVAGHDAEAVKLFINWTAYIVQRRDSPKSAWLFHGTYGTGKGILYSSVLKPIFDAAAVKKPFRDFNDKFNSEIEHSLLVFIDEVHITSDNDSTYQYLKNIISENEVSIRAMRTDFANRRNRTAYILASNEVQPLRIDPGERRLHIPPRQDTPLIQVQNLDINYFKSLESELEAFALFLHQWKVDEQDARIPKLSTAKQQLQEVSTTTQLKFAQAVASGKLDYFMDFVPASLVDNGSASLVFADKLRSDYLSLMIEIIEELPTDKQTHKMIIPRDDLITLYQFSSGANHQQPPAKFTRMMANMNCEIKPLKLNGRSVRGMVVEWEYNEVQLADYKRQLYALVPHHRPQQESHHGTTSSSS